MTYICPPKDASMNFKINTRHGVYTYCPKKLFYGRKIITIKVATENILLFKRIMDDNDVKFGLIYGTLLGAVREEGFIKYDEDTDVFILDEHREAFLDLLFEFRNNGFEVARYETDLISLLRNDDYIDVYFFKKSIFGQRTCCNDSLPESFFKNLGEINFLGARFYTVSNKIAFLEKAYGKDWKTPRKNCPADIKSISYRTTKVARLAITKTKHLIKRILPSKIYRYIKTLKNK